MGASRSPLLAVLGSDIALAARAKGGFRYQGNSDAYELLPEGWAFEQLALDRQFLKRQVRPDLSRYECVLNLITDPDVHPRTLEILRKLLRGFRGRVINRPEAVLQSGRDQVARLLDGIPNFIVPKVIRLKNPKPRLAAQAVERAGMRFPLIARLAGTHTGKILGCFKTSDELGAALTGTGDHILTELVDFRGSDGVYRKYRVFFIGKTIIFRHMLASDGWSIHARDRMRFMIDKTPLLDEERRLFERSDGAFSDTVQQVLAAVAERMPLDYFGMDFGITAAGRPVLFEANATMNFFPFVPDPRLNHVLQCLEPARAAFWQLAGVHRDGTNAPAISLKVAP